MLALIAFMVLAGAVGAILAVTSLRMTVKDRRPSDPAYRFVLTVVWPSGPVTYSWPKR